MPTILFNAFSFLQKKLRDKNIEYSNARVEVVEGSSVADLIERFQLSGDEIEVVMVNGKVATSDTVLKDDDRVAFLPHGTPGPYRVLLGFKNKKVNRT